MSNQEVGGVSKVFEAYREGMMKRKKAMVCSMQDGTFQDFVKDNGGRPFAFNVDTVILEVDLDWVKDEDALKKLMSWVGMVNAGEWQGVPKCGVCVAGFGWGGLVGPSSMSLNVGSFLPMPMYENTMTGVEQVGEMKIYEPLDFEKYIDPLLIK